MTQPLFHCRGVSSPSQPQTGRFVGWRRDGGTAASPRPDIRGPGARSEPGLRLAACLVGTEGLCPARRRRLSSSSRWTGTGSVSRVRPRCSSPPAGAGSAGRPAGSGGTRSWARGPVVAAQLLVLGVAWSSRSVPWLALLLLAMGARGAGAGAASRSHRGAVRRVGPTSRPTSRTDEQAGSLVGGETLAQRRERAGKQPRHVHLRHAHLGGDLGLRHLPEEPQHDDAPLPGGQRRQQRA